MAINIDSYIDVNYSGVTVERIGLSAGMNTISNNDILDYIFCASYNKIIHGVIPRKTDVPMTQYRQEIPFNFEMDDPRVEINAGGYDLNPSGMYMGVIWLYTDIFANHPENNGNLSHFKIVMSWDAPNYFATCPDPNGKRDNISSWNDSNVSKCFATTGTFTSLTYVFQNHNITVSDIYPYMVFKTTEGGDDLLFISCLRQNANTFRVRPYTRGSQQVRFIGTTTLKSFRNNEATYSPVGAKMVTYEKTLPYKWNMGSSPGQASTNPNAYGTTEMQNLFFYTEGGSNSSSTIGCMDWTWFLDTKNESLLFWASGGLKFKAGNKTYKPIISNGLVTGYSDNMATPSDLDKWSGSTKHGIPVTPSSAYNDEDNTDTIPTAGAPYSSGLARYYATTAGSLILSHISQAMGAWNLKDSGKDLYKNIISCKLIKSPAPIPVSGSEPFTVYGVTLQYEGSDITLPVVNDNPTASFGPYNIPRKFNDFRDFAPYTKVEIYLPYCGWTVLPSHVVGRSVSVTYYTDIIAGTCKAVVYCNSNVIAEAAGVIGLDIPMVTENAGAKAEAVTMGLLAYGKAGLQTALGVGAAVASKGKVGVKSAVGGLENLVSAYSQTAMAFNQNYTEINGKNGDGCCIAGISAIVIKITRPKYGSNTTPPYVPSNYAHSTGFVSMQSGTVGSFTGLLVADNVDTSGISGATDREKQLIKLYLESGIFVNHPS